MGCKRRAGMIRCFARAKQPHRIENVLFICVVIVIVGNGGDGGGGDVGRFAFYP